MRNPGSIQRRYTDPQPVQWATVILRREIFLFNKGQGIETVREAVATDQGNDAEDLPSASAQARRAP